MKQDEVLQTLRKVIAESDNFTTWTVSTPHLVELVKRAVEAEREACKKLAKEHAAEYKVGGRLYTMLGMNTSKPIEAACDHIAHLIHERGNT